MKFDEFAIMLSEFDKDTGEESGVDSSLILKSMENPNSLTKKELFKISFTIERMQGYYADKGYQNKMIYLENLRNYILERLK